eukprot:EG_transcript_29279
MPRTKKYWGPRLPKFVKKIKQDPLGLPPPEDIELDFTVVLNYIHSDIFDEGDRYIVVWDALRKKVKGTTEPQTVQNLKLYFDETMQFTTNLSMKVSYVKHVMHKFERMSRAVDITLSNGDDDAHYQWVRIKLKKVKAEGEAGKGRTVDELYLNLLQCADCYEPTVKRVEGEDCYAKVTVTVQHKGEAVRVDLGPPPATREDMDSDLEEEGEG